jgi:hypothetical protein
MSSLNNYKKRYSGRKIRIADYFNRLRHKTDNSITHTHDSHFPDFISIFPDFIRNGRHPLSRRRIFVSSKENIHSLNKKLML